ncbi:GDP-mannose 4,6-dehydratase [Allokutzneria sp. A3M-2-11 16]|uniref:dTDP-glucose 4,6-dehydratase n=1 Tax=Allokutzneria sp. A3M-2-11 16 TaxID=2962043 RepID=UPI0020B893A6|nr:GDP-mannose 4,6-dehydratase [Allokutzneria sp. A3M-2-11 16]MCP3800658.1 GDP-mannose 4,6-dehydratase [Allokutzneria sp. A3M-2-11 16]
MRLLVTGAAGFIGSHFVRHRVRAGDNVIALDALTYAGTETNLADVRDRITFVHADIADAEQVLRDHRVDVIVNFAAESHNSLAILDPGRFFRTNVLGTQALLEAARQVGVERFHHISRCEVYGDLALDAEQAFTEDSPYRPRTPYNASKAGSDHAVRAYYETFGLPITITNCANNYGSHQFPEKVLPLFTTNALDELGLPASLKQEVPDRPGHDRRYLLDSTKIRRELGWEPLVEFDAGVRETVRWYANNRTWWEPLRDRSPVTEGAWHAG